MNRRENKNKRTCKDLLNSLYKNFNATVPQKIIKLSVKNRKEKFYADLNLSIIIIIVLLFVQL